MQMGDLNYRLNCPLPREDLIDRLRRHPRSILQYDQLVHAVAMHDAFDGFSEGTLDFLPTYKYEKGGNRFSSKKEPAWCDRILVKGNCEVKYYSSVPETTCSDHKPVIADIVFDAKKYREEQRNKMAEQVRQQLLMTDCGRVDVTVPETISFTYVTVRRAQSQTLTLCNNGDANAYFTFVPRGNQVCKEWYRISPSRGVIRPHSSCDITVEIDLTPQNLRVLKLCVIKL